MAARKNSLRDLAAKSRKDRLTAANTGPVAGWIAELDPTLVHAGGLEDRIAISQEEIAALAESLRKAGQKVPILVRPHPSRPGEYEIVAGRRRLAACKIAGLQVRAEIQDLDDAALIMGQAIENIAREDLTYIERARLAPRMVDEAGLAPADIDTAFSCGKTDRSRYLKIGRGIPDDILSFVGKAPGVGRPRWEKLLAHMEADEAALGRMREVLAAANIADSALATSDARFSYLFEAAFRTDIGTRDTAPRGNDEQTPEAKEIWVPSHDTPVGYFKRTRSGAQVTLRGSFKPGFLDWLDHNVNAVIVQAMRNYEQDTVLDDLAETLEETEARKHEPKDEGHCGCHTEGRQPQEHDLNPPCGPSGAVEEKRAGDPSGSGPPGLICCCGDEFPLILSMGKIQAQPFAVNCANRVVRLYYKRRQST